LFITVQGGTPGVFSLHMKVKGRPTTGESTRVVSRDQFTPLCSSARIRVASALSISGTIPFSKAHDGMIYSVTGRAVNAGHQADGLYFVMPDKTIR
jgi:hypothetical protein